jgi:hypothetical protein
MATTPSAKQQSVIRHFRTSLKPTSTTGAVFKSQLIFAATPLHQPAEQAIEFSPG